MTETLRDVTPRKKPASSPELEAAKQLVRQAREQGLSLTGPDGPQRSYPRGTGRRLAGHRLRPTRARDDY